MRTTREIGQAIRAANEALDVDYSDYPRAELYEIGELAKKYLDCMDKFERIRGIERMAAGHVPMQTDPKTGRQFNYVASPVGEGFNECLDQILTIINEEIGE